MTGPVFVIVEAAFICLHGNFIGGVERLAGKRLILKQTFGNAFEMALSFQLLFRQKFGSRLRHIEVSCKKLLDLLLQGNRIGHLAFDHLSRIADPSDPAILANKECTREADLACSGHPSIHHRALLRVRRIQGDRIGPRSGCLRDYGFRRRLIVSRQLGLDVLSYDHQPLLLKFVKERIEMRDVVITSPQGGSPELDKVGFVFCELRDWFTLYPVGCDQLWSEIAGLQPRLGPFTYLKLRGRNAGCEPWFRRLQRRNRCQEEGGEQCGGSFHFFSIGAPRLAAGLALPAGLAMPACSTRK
jgi:hypothetical protein